MQRLILFVVLLLGCSSGGPGSANIGGSGGGSCESALAALCDRACACGDATHCRIAIVTDAGSTAISWGSASSCRTGLSCKNADPSTDWSACASAVSGAQCVQASGGGAVAIPPACNDK